MSEKFIPGPWRWEINPKSKDASIVARDGMGTTVMQFERWGMHSATPMFNTKRVMDGPGHMLPAIDFAVAALGREHHADWFKVINHPDANLIAAAPDLYAACNGILELCDKDGRIECKGNSCQILAIVAALKKARGE